MGGQKHNRGRFDRPKVAAVARNRHWVLSVEELDAIGLSERQIRYAADTAFLHPKHHGVYAVGRSELSFAGRCRAAWLACGPKSAVSHVSSAAAQGYRRHFGKIHVSGPRSLEGHPGLIVHRPRSLPLDEIVMRDGFAVTSVGRTLLDMSPGQTPETIGGWMHEARVQGVIDHREVYAVLQRHPHHRGCRRLEAALAVEVVPQGSGLEQAYAGLVREVMPQPRRREWVWSGEKHEEVDFCWYERGLIVEVDGGRYHASNWRRRRDRAKDDRYRALGWVVRRFPEIDIVMDPTGVVAETVRLAGLGRPKRPLMSV